MCLPVDTAALTESSSHYTRSSRLQDESLVSFLALLLITPSTRRAQPRHFFRLYFVLKFRPDASKRMVLLSLLSSTEGRWLPCESRFDRAEVAPKSPPRRSANIQAVRPQGWFMSVGLHDAHFHIPITVIWCVQKHSYVNKCHLSSSGFCQKRVVTTEKERRRGMKIDRENLA